MLLDMLSSCPEFREDFLASEPMSYREHFRLSRFKTRDLAIADYDRADANIRNTLDTLAVTMTIVLEATRAAMDDVEGGPRRLRHSRQCHRPAEAVDRPCRRNNQR